MMRFLSVALVILPMQFIGCTGVEVDEVNNNELSLVYGNSQLTWAINLNCKYVLTQWWNEPKDVAFQETSYLPNAKPLTEEQQIEVEHSIESFKNWRNEDYLLIPNWQKSACSEQAILPPCYACRILSSAIHYGLFNVEITGISIEEATKKTVLLISSLVKYHCSNSENGWGNCWQGALWAEMLGMSACFMKDYLSDDVWTLVCNMIRSECDYVVSYAGVNVYKDRRGTIINEGDSKAEENAWNATILALAIAAIPDDTRQGERIRRFIELNITAMSRPSDVFSDKIIDGYSFENSPGSNINEDGSVVNHGKWHIDYMASPIESLAESSIALSYARERKFFNCLCFNVDIIYNALVELDLGKFDSSKTGHHFYERTRTGETSSTTNMPGNNEWGSNRQANYFLVDIYADLIGADRDLPDRLKANKWAKCRLEKITEMMRRDNSGRIYQDGEEHFASGQLYAMACLTQAYSLLRGDILPRHQ